jgi:hypothetical protein
MECGALAPLPFSRRLPRALAHLGQSGGKPPHSMYLVICGRSSASILLAFFWCAIAAASIRLNRSSRHVECGALAPLPFARCELRGLAHLDQSGGKPPHSIYLVICGRSGAGILPFHVEVPAPRNRSALALTSPT